MNSSWSVSLYRFLMQAYPIEFRKQYGQPIDQAFRDMHRDAFQKRGYLGLALLWFHVVPDFLFSAGEVLLSKAGDFLKWRFRLQWVVACTLGFVLSRLVSVAIGWEFLRGLGPEPWVSAFLQPVILMGSIGLMQSRALAGRCFRKKQWVLYGLAGALLGMMIYLPLSLVVGRRFLMGLGPWAQVLVLVLILVGSVGLILSRVLAGGRFRAMQSGLWCLGIAALGVMVFQPEWIEMRILQMIDPFVGGELPRFLVRNVFGNTQIVLFGACTGLLQSAAVKNDAITRYRWMTACAAGYYLSAVAGSPFMEYTPTFVAGTMLSALVTGTVLGLITSGPLEQILFNAQADSKEQS